MTLLKKEKKKIDDDSPVPLSAPPGRRGVIERQRPHVVAERAGVPEPVVPEHLVVGEVERAPDAVVAAVPGVVPVPVAAAWLAPREVRHERPPPPLDAALREPRARQRRLPRLRVPLVLPARRVPPPQQRHRRRPPLHRLVPRRDAAEPPHDLHPVALEVVAVLQEHLLPPRAAPVLQHVHQRRLVVRLVEQLVPERGREHGAPPLVVRRVGPHGGPGVHEVERPLAVAHEEHAGVEARPRRARLVVHEARPAVDDEVVATVPAQREAEVHVGEHGVRVHPPEPLRLRVRHHGGPDHRDLGPVPVHGRPEQRRVVQQLHAVEAAVVRLVLEEPRQQVVAGRGAARRRLRAGHHQDASLAGAGQLRVRAEPLGALLVPPGDGTVHGVRHLRVVVEGPPITTTSSSGRRRPSSQQDGGRSEGRGQRQQQHGGHRGAGGEEERVAEEGARHAGANAKQSSPVRCRWPCRGAVLLAHRRRGGGMHGAYWLADWHREASAG
uniref:Uncharacterized protein n=1 Tax=Hordeum vulgare subsp. vulgare TaxID=112509 RepID=A0A8I6Y3Z9_HORVV